MLPRFQSGRFAPALVEALESRVLLFAAVVKDINTGTEDSQFNLLGSAGNTVLFNRTDPVTQAQQLYASDGTPAGTRQVTGGLPPYVIVDAVTSVAPDKIFFLLHNQQLWVMNGALTSATLV